MAGVSGFAAFRGVLSGFVLSAYARMPIVKSEFTPAAGLQG